MHPSVFFANYYRFLFFFYILLSESPVLISPHSLLLCIPSSILVDFNYLLLPIFQEIRLIFNLQLLSRLARFLYIVLSVLLWFLLLANKILGV